jgi:hypothetical protein
MIVEREGREDEGGMEEGRINVLRWREKPIKSYTAI